MSCLTTQVESLMTSQVSPTSTNHWSCHSYTPHVDYTCDWCWSSCSKSPTLWFCGSNRSPKRAVRPPRTQSPPIAIHPKMALATNQHALPASSGTLMTSTTAPSSTCGMEPQHTPDALQKVASSIQMVMSYATTGRNRKDALGPITVPSMHAPAVEAHLMALRSA